MGIPVQLGFKLALGWRAHVACGRLPEPRTDLYALLRDAGFAFFEFGTGTCRDEAERALLRAEAAACAKRGLRTALHPYTKGEEDPAAFGTSAECAAAMLAMLRVASETADGDERPSSRMVLHAAQTKHRPAGRAVTSP